MEETDMIPLTAPRLVEVRSALQALKEKRLPSTDAETMVASMWYRMRDTFDEHDDVVKKIRKLLKDADASEDEAEQKELRQQADKMADDLTDKVYMVRRPKSRIQHGHLPKAHKGKEGDENPTGNAGIIIALGPEFYEGIDEA